MADETPQTPGVPGSVPQPQQPQPQQPQPQVPQPQQPQAQQPQVPQGVPQSVVPVPPGTPQGAAGVPGQMPTTVPTTPQGGAAVPTPQQPVAGAQPGVTTGTPVGATSVPKPKKPVSRQTILIIIAVVVAIICLVVGGLVGSSRENSRIRNLSDDELKSEFGYVRQENVPSGTSSTKGKTNSNGGSTGTELTGDVSADWQDSEFSIDGHKFKLGESTLGDLMDQAGWEFEDASYEDGYVVNPDQTVGGIMLKHTDYEYLYIGISVTNTGDEQMDIKDCKLSAFNISYNTYSKQTPTVVIAGGITLGQTTYDDAKAALSDDPSDEVSGSGYQGMSFTSRDYTTNLSLSFYESNNNVLSTITMSKRV